VKAVLRIGIWKTKIAQKIDKMKKYHVQKTGCSLWSFSWSLEILNGGPKSVLQFWKKKEHELF
jgi:hypothetical protein